MHELTIAESVLSIVEQAVPREKTITVTSVKLQVGELSGIEVESLKFALSVLRSDTIARDATFDIGIIPGEAECKGCKTVFAMHQYGDACPTCGNYDATVTKGREMQVLSILLDEE
ncbi:MAG TPA: hydrogenase maturation nickel metallochaperone HypA [Chitinophagaceae bacterium]